MKACKNKKDARIEVLLYSHSDSKGGQMGNNMQLSDGNTQLEYTLKAGNGLWWDITGLSLWRPQWKKCYRQEIPT